MTWTPDLDAVSTKMLELEDQRDDPREDVPVGVVAAKLLDVEHSESFDAALARESSRTIELMRGHYARHGLSLVGANVAALAFVQGITFAVAVKAVQDEERNSAGKPQRPRTGSLPVAEGRSRMSEAKPPTPLAEWQAEMERRGKLDCKFVCPVCGNVASPNDWKALLPDLDRPDRAVVECIGRAMPRAERRAAFPTEDAAQVIEWWDDPQVDTEGAKGFNARYYRHLGCDEGNNPWIVPQDGAPPPSREDDECARCCQVFPLVPKRPCDYAAFGLFNVCTASVERPDGKVVGVFEFAEAS